MLRDETIQRGLKFRDDRDWRQFRDKLSKVREELADVLSYCILMADVYGLDLDEIMNAKVDKNEAKYPVEKARGRADKYTELK